VSAPIVQALTKLHFFLDFIVGRVLLRVPLVAQHPCRAPPLWRPGVLQGTASHKQLPSNSRSFEYGLGPEGNWLDTLLQLQAEGFPPPLYPL